MIGSPTVTAFLDRAAAHSPAAPALSWRSVRWSYCELEAAVRAMAAYLGTLGIGPGTRVGLLFRNSPQYVAAYYGALSGGCAAVPFNPYENARELIRQIGHCSIGIVVGDPGHPQWPALAAAAESLGLIHVAIPVDDTERAHSRLLHQLGDPTRHEKANITGDMLATIVYTSGTTGKPKGVMLSHANLGANTTAIRAYLGLTDSDCGTAVLPLQFSYGSSILHTHLATGAQLLLEDSIAYPHAVLQRMADAGVTGFGGVPSTFALLMTREEFAPRYLPQLRYMTQAGGAMPAARIRSVRERFPKVLFFVMYGQTEATARLSYLPPAKVDAKPDSVGIPIPGVEISVVRPDGTWARTGEIGEIVARGPGVMQGYVGDEEATRAVIREGWLHTGDLGHMDEDGFLYVDGRASEMFKVGAFRISPQEIEDVITEMPEVKEAGVVGIPDELLGHAVKAVVVLKEGRQLEARAVKEHCHGSLAAYKVPKLVEFAKALPCTASGKIQRRRLA